MNAWYYALAAYQLISWIWIIISIKTVPSDVELFGEEVE